MVLESVWCKFYGLGRLWSWQERESRTQTVAETKLEVEEASWTKPLRHTFVASALTAGCTKTCLGLSDPGICMVKLSESRMSGSSACFCFVNPLPTLVQTSLSVRNDQAQCYSTLLLGTEAKVRSHSAARLRQRSAVLLAASSGDRSQRDACLLMVTKERIHFWNS